jgi:hypothetical protein
LIDLHHGEPRIERVTFGSDGADLLLQFRARGLHALLDDLVHFAGLELRLLFEPTLLLDEFVDLIGIDAVEALLQRIAFFRQRLVGFAKLIELRLLDRALDIEEESAVALRVE